MGRGTRLKTGMREAEGHERRRLMGGQEAGKPRWRKVTEKATGKLHVVLLFIFL